MFYFSPIFNFFLSLNRAGFVCSAQAVRAALFADEVLRLVALYKVRVGVCLFMFLFSVSTGFQLQKKCIFGYRSWVGAEI